MKYSKVLFVTFLFFAIQLSAKKVYVNDNSTTGDIYTTAIGAAGNNGTTTATPKLTLAQALAISVNGDTILVDKGNYISITNAINVQVTIIGAGSGNTIFTGNATVNRFGTISVSNVKIMNMNFINYYLNQEGQVLLINASLTGIIFENIVIRKNPGTATAGANVLVSSGSNVVFNNCVFSCSGWNADFGGAIYVDNSTVSINNCLFKDDRNFARYGGAIYMFGASPNVTVLNSTFSECSARRGGAIYQNSGVLTVNGCCFSDNFSAGDASDPNHGGGAFCQNDGTSSFTNCRFNDNYNSQGADPNNGSVDGGAILFRGATGTFSFNTCSFSNNIPFDTGADFYLDEGASLTGTITNCTFTTAPIGEVNIRNFDMEAGDVVLANSGTPSFVGTVFTAPGSNTLSPSSIPNAICMNTNIANCSASINCATETLPPLIISCVANKTLTGCSSVLGNYVAEVVAFDDCSFTVSQNPAPGTIITAVTQVTMTVTDQAGNATICTFFVTPGTGGVTLTTNATTSVTCFGAATGAATVSPSGGSGTYTVTWMPGSLTGTVQTGLAANVYTVTATDGTCTATQNVTISQPASAVTVSLSASSNTICSNNTVTLTPSGASTYTLNPGPLTGTSFTLSPSSNQTYTLTGTSAEGCVSANSATTAITVNTTPTVSVLSVSNPTICSGNSTVITPSGASTYTLNPGSLTGTSFTVSPSSNQTYTLTGTSASGCLSANSATTTITVNTTPTVSIASVSNPTICSGNSTVITPSGASSYTLNPGALTGTSFTVSPNSNQTYTLTGTSVSGCISANSATTAITVNTTPTVSVLSVSNPTICSGNSTVITPSGASTYTLNPGALTGTSFTVSPNSNQTYTLTGTSVAGCVSANSATTAITVNTTPTVAIASVSNGTICSGNTVTITPSGASTYTLNPGSLTGTSFTVSPNSNQTYTLTGTSSLGCVSANTATETIVVNATPTVNIATNNLSLCSGNPLVMPIVSGGTVILWQGPNSFTSSLAQPTVTSSIAPIHAGNYSVTVAQSYGANTCTSSIAQVTVSVVSSANIGITGGQSQNLCLGSTLNVIPTGGNTYTLQPDNLSALSFTLNPTSNSTYTVLGSAGSGCDGSVTFSVNINQLPVVSIAPSNTSICSGNSVILTASSGSISADTYTWSSNAGSANSSTVSVSPTINSTYTVTGTNSASGCTNTAAQSIIVNTTPTVGITSVTSPTICSGNSTVITPNGATTYTLNPGALTGTSFTVNPTSNQTYSIIGTSLEGCISANEVTTDITVNTTPTVGIASVTSPTICSGNSTVITPNGAASYTLNPGALVGTSFTVSPTSNQTYSITGTSTDGCVSGNEATANIAVNTTPTVAIASVSSLTICSGNSTVITPNGAVTYTLNPGALTGNSFTVNPTSNLTYSIIGTSPEGCISANEVTTDITVNTTPTVGIASVTSPTICSDNSTVITPNGAASYTLNPGALVGTNFTVSPTSNQTYSITGTSMEGCISANEVTTDITVNTSPTVGIASVTSPTICSGNSAVITPNGAVTYTLNPGALTGNSFTVNPTSNQTYSITGVSSEGCISGNEATTDITVNITPTANAVSNPTTVCTSGTVSLIGSSSVALPTFTWSTGNGITVSNQNLSSVSFPATGLSSGTYVYTLTASSPEGCPSSPVTTTINIINTPNSSFTLSALSTCQNQNAILNIDNVQSGVNYSWNVNGLNSSNTSSVSIGAPLTSTAGIYPISVIAVVGTCSNTSSSNFTVNANPTISLINTSIVACPDEAVQLEVMNPVNSSNYSWSFAGSVVGSGSVLSINPLTTSNAGSYMVGVTDVNGCQAQTTGLVETKDCFVFVPEIFTPNGDGKNDSFVITNIQNYPNNNLKIFNRWGSLVYEKDKYNNEFDGHANVSALGSDKLPAGTYYVILNFNDGKTETYNGYLLLQY